jgi:hypothetical protein
MDKAKIVDTYINEDGHMINVYESGAEYNTVTNRLVKPASHTLITAENSTDMYRRSQEVARAAFIDGANDAVDKLRPDLAPESLGDKRYVYAVGYVTQQKALTAKDPKQTDAARLLLNVGERFGDRQEGKTGNTTNILVVDADVRRALELLKNMQDAQLHE